MSLRLLLVGLAAGSLVLPPQRAAAHPWAVTLQPSDRDVDGVTDDVDQCPDTYGAPNNYGCPPQAQPVNPDRDVDGVPDASDLCPDAPNYTADGCAAPTTTTPPVDVDPNDEYQVLLRTLPQDFDINYRFDGAAKKYKRENDPGRIAKRMKGLGVAGGTLTLVGAVGMLSVMTAGLVMSKQAKDELEGMETSTTSPIDGSGRQALLDKGEKGDKVAIIGTSVGGGVTALGVMLLIGARSLRKKQYGSTSSGGSGGSTSRMSDSDRKKFILTGGLLLVYGLIGMAAGGALLANKDASKQKTGKVVMGISGTLAALGVVFLVPPIIAKRRTASTVTGGPMWVKSGGGIGVNGRF
ncbi:MAG: hypothetical protein K1X88_22450 [Nannocystaceae bacterium]|nr:hypothetical protein [Nannocystaceae bacterium]